MTGSRFSKGLITFMSVLDVRADHRGLFTVLPSHSVLVHTELKGQEADPFLADALLRYDNKSIQLPGRFSP